MAKWIVTDKPVFNGPNHLNIKSHIVEADYYRPTPLCISFYMENKAEAVASFANWNEVTSWENFKQQTEFDEFKAYRIREIEGGRWNGS